MKSLIISLVLMLNVAYAMAEKPFETDNFQTENGLQLGIGFIEHGSLIMSFDGKTMYIDPVSEYTDYSRLPKADIILITHEHDDHLDKKAIEAVEKSGTRIIANAASVKILGRGTQMKNGDELQPDKWLSIEAVPAYNTTAGHEQFHPHTGRDNGYVLTIGGKRIYIAGDTENIPELAKLKNIDIAFLPVNQPYTMTVAQAVDAAKVISPKILYPYHYGETKIDELANGLKSNEDIEVRIRNLK